MLTGKSVDGMHNYKLIRYPLNAASSTTDLDAKATRFDLLLLEMVDLIRDRWGYVHTERFALTGYSGGAQVGLPSRAEAIANPQFARRSSWRCYPNIIMPAMAKGDIRHPAVFRYER
jgi:hypothetical protein